MTSSPASIRLAKAASWLTSEKGRRRLIHVSNVSSLRGRRRALKFSRDPYDGTSVSSYYKNILWWRVGLPVIRMRSELICLGCHDGGYAPFLNDLITKKQTDKLLLPGYVAVPDSIKQLQLHSFHIPDLFESEPLLVKTPQAGTASLASSPGRWSQPLPGLDLSLEYSTDPESARLCLDPDAVRLCS
jgi:hypothetical protein